MKRFLLLVLVLGLTWGLTGCFGTEAALEKQMKSPDPEVRRETATQLGELATPRALQVLELNRDDPDFRVRDAVRAAIDVINKRTFMK
ncbi:MAG: HEAT repeat domain-containing protein [Candidatus Riflebacteria bacterium]|nr:HEAT repeat domain-containing protein [Candidatus Riflebacteria bacterium]